METATRNRDKSVVVDEGQLDLSSSSSDSTVGHLKKQIRLDGDDSDSESWSSDLNDEEIDVQKISLQEKVKHAAEDLHEEVETERTTDWRNNMNQMEGNKIVFEIRILNLCLIIL